jgi:hypothetical protein
MEAEHLPHPANPLDTFDHSNDVPPFTTRATTAPPGGFTLAADIDSATCSISLSTANGTCPGTVLQIDEEFIRVTARSGPLITGCVRGFGASVATRHTAGTKYAATDWEHFGALGDTDIAQRIQQWIQAHP